MSTGRPLRDERGLSLAELSVTLALFAMIMLGVVATWSKAQEAYFVGSETAEVQQNVRAAIDFMVREFRATGRDVTVCAFDYAVTSGTSSLDCTTDKVAACQLTLTGNYNTNNGVTPASTGITPANGPGCTSLFPIPYVSGQYPTAAKIRIRSDRNDNGRIAGMGNSITSPASAADPGAEDVTYALANPCPSGIPGACITRDDGTGPVAMVAVDISGFVLTYYPRPGFFSCVAVGGVIPNPCPAYTGSPQIDSQEKADNIGRINIVVTAVQTTAGQTITRSLTTDVMLRNRS